MLNRIVIFGFIVFMLTGAAGASPRYDGKAAYDRGDFAMAMQIWKPLAEAGDAFSEYNIGLIYAYGKGVAIDYAEAAKWYRAAADQGYVYALVGLGKMYLAGDGMPPDKVQAYMWMDIAASRGDRDAGDYRETVAKQMTPEQIAEAQALAREWKPKAGR